MIILIIAEDSPDKQRLKVTLGRASFSIDSASNGKQGSYMARTKRYDLIVLDTALSSSTAIDVCTELRSSGTNTPIIILSRTSTLEEKIRFFDLGADDYLTEPYSDKELLARIRAITRRPAAIEAPILSAGNIKLDSRNGQTWNGPEEIHLTPKEFCILELLLKNIGATVSRGTILEQVWNIDSEPLSKTIETHVLNLRKKLETQGKKMILTIPGRGYKIGA